MLNYSPDIEVVTQEQICEPYTNSRFAYEVDYPCTYFNAQKVSDNADGTTLFNTDEKYRLIASGGYNVLNYDTEDLVKNYIVDLRKEYAVKVTVLEKTVSKNKAEIVVLTNSAYHHVQYYLTDDTYISVTFTAPQQDPETFYTISEKIELYLEDEMASL